VSLNFNNDGDRLITGSFDHTTKVWDVKSGR
jgi:dynein assembly factor with WDR repeat domains 1